MLEVHFQEEEPGYYALNMRFEDMQDCMEEIENFVMTKIIFDSACNVLMVFVIVWLHRIYTYKHRVEQAKHEAKKRNQVANQQPQIIYVVQPGFMPPGQQQFPGQ